MSANRSHNVSREPVNPFTIIRPWEFPLLIKVITYGGFILTLIACLIYLEIIIAFVRNPLLITPFSIHIVNMVAINLVAASIYEVMLALNWYRTKTIRFGVVSTVTFVTRVVRFATILVPQGFIIVSYPLLVYKVLRRTRVTIGAQGGRPGRRSGRGEIRLVMWLVILEIIFWMPATMMAILGNLRIALPFLDVNAWAFDFATVLHTVDPVVYLLFLGNLRQEIKLHLRGLLGLPVQGLPVQSGPAGNNVVRPAAVGRN
ncbi:hypothetical protein BV898_16549 [Hypsibius exemplaris]|uniref:G-protein coupled receptors family 1 profile domain-containing protein n=1 Tax=Hypsibius exemplaris TaxID=2072580 RepID=A0A9X6RLY0_HYPEX|nr:hypothetical protein BV898_16549 [Hypsibius exemplaris]